MSRATRTTMLQAMCPELLPIISTSSNASETTYLADSLLIDPANVQLTPESANDSWIELPAQDPPHRERRVGGNGGAAIDTTNGYIYPTAPFNAAPDAVSWRWWKGIRPFDAYNLYVLTAQNLQVPDDSTLLSTTDADMEASGTTSYSISGAGSISKVTTAANVHKGLQSLFFNAGTAGEYVEGPSARVQPGQQYFASTIARVDAGGPAIFVIWDKTNDAEIDNGGRISHSLEAFMSMQRTFSVPSTCEEIALRVYVTGSSDDVYIDRFIGPYKGTDTAIDAPSYLTRDVDFRKIQTARYMQQYSAGVYDANSRVLEPLYIRDQDVYFRSATGHAHPNKIEFRASIPLQEMWIETLRVSSDFATDAFTSAGEAISTQVDDYFFCLHWLSRILTSMRGKYAWVAERMEWVQAELLPLQVDFAEGDAETPQAARPQRLFNMAGF